MVKYYRFVQTNPLYIFHQHPQYKSDCRTRRYTVHHHYHLDTVGYMSKNLGIQKDHKSLLLELHFKEMNQNLHMVHCHEKCTCYLVNWKITASFPESVGSWVPFFGTWATILGWLFKSLSQLWFYQYLEEIFL